MTPTALFLAALVVSLLAELFASPRGRSIEGWAIVLVCLGLLWGKL